MSDMMSHVKINFFGVWYDRVGAFLPTFHFCKVMKLSWKYSFSPDLTIEKKTDYLNAKKSTESQTNQFMINDKEGNSINNPVTSTEYCAQTFTNDTRLLTEVFDAINQVKCSLNFHLHQVKSHHINQNGTIVWFNCKLSIDNRVQTWAFLKNFCVID